nr:MAG TPA: minor tail protein [Caudoviricetes sp.]DAR11941.1 MAG TPA: minor tail protein [Bacteriophage sp.]
MKADGSVIIDTEINEDGIKAGSESINKALKNMAASTADLNDKARIAIEKQINSVSKMNQQYTTQLQKVEELREKIEEMRKEEVPTQEYSSLTAEIEKLEKSLDAVIEKEIKFVETGGNTESSAFKRMEYDIDQLNAKLDTARAKKKALEDSGGAYTPMMNTDSGAAAVQRLEQEEQKLDNMNNQVNMSYKALNQKVSEYREKMEDAGNETEKTTKKTKNATKSVIPFGKSILSLGKMVKLMLIRQAIRAMISAAKEGLQNLAQYSKSVNKDMSMLMSSMTRLKNSFATAFAPILSVVAPILSKFIDMISRAVTAVGQLFAALTGKKTFTKAVAVQQDYAASLDKTADSTEDAEKAAEGYLSPLDEINKLEKKDTEKDKSGASGGVSPEDMFAEVPIDSKFQEWAAKIKEKLQPIIDAIKRLKEPAVALLKSLGDTCKWLWDVILAPLFNWLLSSAIPKIIDILGKLLELIKVIVDWINKNVLPIIKPIVTALLNTVMGVVDGILEVMDGLLDFLIGAFTGDWDRAFSGLQKIASGFKKIVDSVFQGIRDIMETFDGWLQKAFAIDWSESFGVLGEVLNIFLRSVSDIWEGIKKVFNGIVTFINGAFAGNWRQCWEGIKEILAGVWQAIVGVVKAPINLIIGLVNAMIDACAKGINAVIGALNKINVKVPKWVPKYGGKKFGFDIGKVRAPHIPYLATGAVIPPNAPFMAMLGDQRSGNNLEMPENLLRRIIREESGQKSGGSYRFVGQINRRVLFDEFISEAKMRQAATGINPLELG